MASKLEEAADAANKRFGAGSVMLLGDSKKVKVDVIPTGSLALDIATGIGGWPRGRIVEVAGPESSGKTTLAIHAIAEVQKMGLQAFFIDAEHAFDKTYAAQVGVDVNKLMINQPDCGEDALEIADMMIKSGEIALVVIDSVATLVPKAELDGEMGENKMGLHARLMSQAMRKLVGVISKTNTCVIFINQLRDKIGVMFSNPEVTTGGNALKFYSSIRVDIRKSGGTIKNKEGVAVENHTKVKVIKNKLSPPFTEAEFDIEFGVGISKAGEIIDIGEDLDVLKKSGAWYSYGEIKLGNGRPAAKQFLLDNPELMEELESKIKLLIKSK